MLQLFLQGSNKLQNAVSFLINSSYKLHSMQLANLESSLNRNRNETTVIVFWTDYFGIPLNFSRSFEKCAHLNCMITFDHSLERNASAFIFHLPNFRTQNIPLGRSPNQLYVLFSLESPANTRQHRIAENFFNLTMSFRRDSDVHFPYGQYDLLENPLSDLELNEMIALKLENKSKPVAWFVSNCYSKSRREQYVAELQKYIQVDVYGNCGSLRCPCESELDCDRLIERQYYFYLSFENSNCRDYITEKFWQHGMQYYVVPIVLQRKLYTEIAQERSFIAADDFASPAELAKYLKRLMNNPREYASYFAYKKTHKGYFLWLSKTLFPNSCKLCQRILCGDKCSDSNAVAHQDFNKWWFDDPNC